MKSNELVGKRVCVQGYWGVITESSTYIKSETNRETTRFKVKFDPCDISNTVYDNGTYGCYTDCLEQFYVFE